MKYIAPEMKIAYFNNDVVIVASAIDTTTTEETTTFNDVVTATKSDFIAQTHTKRNFQSTLRPRCAFCFEQKRKQKTKGTCTKQCLIQGTKRGL